MTVKEKLSALIAASNVKTGEADGTVTEAMQRLIDGYGKGGEAFAAISVTYPAGSICTASNGTDTLSAPDTSGNWLCLVPSGGTWRIIATYSVTGETAFTDVEITEQYSVKSVSISFLVPTEYQRVEYLQSTGTQYISTGEANSGFACEVEVEYAVDQSSITIGSIATNNARNYFGIQPGNDSKLYLQLGYGSVYPLGPLVSFGQKYSVDFCTINERQKLVVNGTTYTTPSNSGSRGNANLCLFGIPSIIGGSQKIYSCKVYSDYNKSVMTHHFVPCYRLSDNVAGMWDAVTETFYTNSGSGTFVVGGNA